ncbi:MAG TPA: MBL fold metallo-hydrolase [Vicinamibacterales bacterium]|nr:MBL fold metallo-hydrolase [Vicinamibacterales bacterium]
MIVHQFYLNCLAHASYLVGDEQTKTAAVVDPQRDIDQYLAFAQSHGLTIRHVLLTHLHADFIAGHLELRDRTGAAIYLGKAATTEYAFTPLGDGDRVEFGRVRLQALETPGHTPESISILVFDLDKSDRDPYAVLTGDTLFVGDVGRPDLRVALGWAAADLGSMLYDSLWKKLLPLPDSALVYPAHGAGSLCGKALGKETFSTIGEQRRVNYALQPMSKAEFVDIVTADQPDAPPYFVYDAVLNSRERPTLDETLARELQPMDLDAVLAAQAAGGQLLDARDPGDFAAAHVKGSINVGLGGQYATWAGTVLGHDRPIVIIAEPGREREAATRLGRIGFDNIAGYLNDGIRSLEARPDVMSTIERLSPAVAAERHDAVLVDVRAPRERDEKHIAGSVSVPLSQLVSRANELPRDRPLIVYCAGGYRSSIAASVLENLGFTNVSEVAGGIAAWETAVLHSAAPGSTLVHQ